MGQVELAIKHSRAHVLQGGADGGGGGVGLGGQRQGDGGVAEGEGGLGKADHGDGLGGGDGDLQGVGVGQADVLAGGDHQAPGDEAGVLACLDHPGQVVQGGVDVGAADGLDQGAGDVVVLVAVAVVLRRGPVDRLLQRGQGDRHSHPCPVRPRRRPPGR
ncbi:hypothetical protein LSPH24S_07702 [Lysinibacillus sphaericus]